MTITPASVREAADTLAELSALAGYRYPDHAAWNAESLRREATVLEAEVPQ